LRYTSYILSYLVTSKARKEMLRLLWAEGLTASVQELSSKAGVSYGAAHRELGAMEQHGLAVSKGTGKAVLYAANSKFPQAGLLRKLVAEEKSTQPDDGAAKEEAVVVANLQKLGAPLTTSEASQEQLPPEETLARALVVSRKNATVLRVLPYVYAQVADHVDLDAVREKAVEYRQERCLGFVLDVAGQLSRNPRLNEEANKVFGKRVKRDELFFELKGKYERKLAMQNTPEVARKWHFVMNMPMDSFRTLYEKYAGGRE
jgi:hypothetical protein